MVACVQEDDGKMIALVNAISDEVVAQLEDKGWPELRRLPNGDEGRIIISDFHKLDLFMPPRIVFLPARSKFGARDTTRGPVKVANNRSGYDEQSRAVIGNPALGSERLTFDVRCWGIATDIESDDWEGAADFEYTQVLYHALLAACETLVTGCYEAEPGNWAVISHGKRVGREFQFGLNFGIPVLKEIQRYDETPNMPRAGAGVRPHIADSMITANGESLGCEGGHAGRADITLGDVTASGSGTVT
jgi:hypothetical protein